MEAKKTWLPPDIYLKPALTNIRVLDFYRYIAFAKSSFLLSPLPPTGGEGQGEGGAEKTFGNEYKEILAGVQEEVQQFKDTLKNLL